MGKLVKFDGGGKTSVLHFAYINGGILMIALGIHLFKTPNHFALGGVSGISIILGHYLPNLSVGGIMITLNALMVLLGYLLLGRDVAARSLYGSFALSGMVWLLELVVPLSEPLTNQTFMELLYGVFLPGIGGAVVFNFGATTGGTDIIAKILSKRFKLKVSVSLLCSDFLIALCAGLVYGTQACLFSILGVCLKSFVLDSFLESLQVKKIIVIISPESEKIKDFICHTLNRGATVHKARGAYTVGDKEVITTVVSRGQAVKLQNFCNEVDPDAFITISNSSKILGKGFQRFE